ncbi:RNA-dependent RNA polymerase [Beihai weivirus-like virus 20]|uniref:RNA-dependent RNA polymerase n=1 Tax=Beihai weivirus-like virus 20 TaxID=1922749 RepID=UPI00090AAAAF|nr:RNA-dependent RNA polymerase [Beihai weivirus-like virus 20]APG78124.1 RNA-dependent RNA polymerase [Beihai weivirus-like virus 20]
MAEAAERVNAQQAAFRDGTTITSTVVEAPGAASTSGQAEGAEVGTRVARPRFPSMSEEEVFLFSNDPRNLEAANTLRNKGVGVHQPSEKEAAVRDELVDVLCDMVFTKRESEKAMMEYESLTKTALPRKLSEEQKLQWQQDALAAAEGDGLSYSKFIDAFVKAEVSAKPKPRPIANHKEIRLCALAKCAWTYEHVLFRRMNKMSIKHRTKSEALSDVANALSSMKNGRWCENDLTAFEFGISAKLKACECAILRHVASQIGIEDVGSLLFERVVNDRTKTCVWSMRYTDETGEKRTFRLILPTVMRESGDRLTSSGNFLQNLIAWCSFLLAPGTVRKSVESLLRTRGEHMFYCSARDGKKYLAKLVFEGDDTLGRLDEPVWEPKREGATESLVDDFFYRWGWKPKLSWKATSGYDYARVVGYDILIKDGVAVRDGDKLVACPEMRRLLNTKQWTTTNVTPEELKTCNRIFAATLAADFTRVEPMYSFLRSMYDSNPGGKTVTDEKVREHFLMMTGELPAHGSSLLSDIAFPEFDGAGNDVEWKALARVSCGDFTDLEWATACAQPLHDRHGADLATGMPASWVGTVA